jgi:hypothetical protein
MMADGLLMAEEMLSAGARVKSNAQPKCPSRAFVLGQVKRIGVDRFFLPP